MIESDQKIFYSSIFPSVRKYNFYKYEIVYKHIVLNYN